jgi:membrane-associated protein
VVSGLAFAESCVGIGIFVSGALLLIATTLLFNNDILDLYQIGTLAFAGAIIGDQVGFWLGFRAGPGFHHTRLAKRYASQLTRGEQLVLRHGGFAVFTGRFIPAIRSLVPALLGVAGYDRRKYVLLDTVACASWAAALCLLTMLGSAALGSAAD